jgi:predicted enzyme related to lactoylglutathione lyase
MPFGDICHLEFRTTDFEKFKKYYEFFKWTFRPWDNEYMLFMFPNDKLGGGVALVKEPNPLKNVDFYLYTDSIDSTIPKALEVGWKLVREKTPIPQVGFFATLADFDGNEMSIFENLPEEKA